MHLPSRASFKRHKAVLIHRAHHACHCTYLSLVAVEGHGYYSYAAGALLVVLVTSLFTKDAPDGPA